MLSQNIIYKMNFEIVKFEMIGVIGIEKTNIIVD
jgi:hypothetical protein